MKRLTTIMYISRDLQNPDAALRTARNRKHQYYPIYVRNYMVLYVVIGDVMEVRRFVYGKRGPSRLV
jgi:hypothetical protein